MSRSIINDLGPRLRVVSSLVLIVGFAGCSPDGGSPAPATTSPAGETAVTPPTKGKKGARAKPVYSQPGSSDYEDKPKARLRGR